MQRKNILIVAATAGELETLIGAPGLNSVSTGQVFPINHKRHTINLLVTGPGMVATTYYLAKLLGSLYYDMAINAGIAGSFNKKFSIGETVNVISDCFPELGAENGNRFIPIYKMEMSKPYMPDFMDGNGVIENLSYPRTASVECLPAARGITVNTISGENDHIEMLKKRAAADIETMEGAAFLYACHMSGLPCLQIRAISNYIEERNLKNWDIPYAVKKLNENIMSILDEI